jgi:hypothetical protein
MHTIIVTGIGFVLLGLLTGLSRSKAIGALRFIPVWLVLCLIHLGYGVVVAGYGLVEELGVHAVVFGLPAIVALGRNARDRPKA